MKLGIFYSVCGAVAIISVVSMVVLSIIGTYGEQPSVISVIVRVIVGSVIGVGALSSGVAKIRIARLSTMGGMSR